MRYFSKSYWLLWIGFFISNVGDWMLKIALPLLVYAKTGSAFQMAATFGIAFLPWILFSMIGGLIADKWHKKRTLVIGNVISAMVLFSLLALTGMKNVNIVWLYVAVFVFSSIEPLTHPTFQAVLPRTVRKEQLVVANASFQLIDNIVTLMGPIVGGTIVATWHPQFAILLDGITFLVTGMLLMRLKLTEAEVALNSENWMMSFVAGLKATRTQPVILAGATLFVFTNFAIYLYEANMVFYITHSLKLSASALGWILGIGGGGALLGTLVTPKLNQKIRSGQLISTSTILAGFGTFTLLLTHNVFAIGLALGIINFFGTINVITYFSLRQQLVPPELLGRVVSVTRMISYTAIPIGAFVGGVLLSHNVPFPILVMIAGIIRVLAGMSAKFTALGRS